ncbi:MAG: GlsB/YeaQ/YmgE family stress response membrane protein [Deltaproteobacteria bacterium]|nr:GlsB/YeaQ/YmgE family stress response membrane protein [Deltaproteobacteria bacterium]
MLSRMLGTIIVGLLVGAVARWIKPGEQAIGWILTALLGVGGAVIATYIGQQLGWYAVGAHAGFIASVAGAVVLLSAYEAVKLPLAKRNRELPPGE